MSKFRDALEQHFTQLGRNPTKALQPARIIGELTVEDLASVADCDTAERVLVDKLYSIAEVDAKITETSACGQEEMDLRRHRSYTAKRFAERALAVTRAKRDAFMRAAILTSQTQQDGAILDALHREHPDIYKEVSAQAQVEKPELFIDHVFARKA